MSHDPDERRTPNGLRARVVRPPTTSEQLDAWYAARGDSALSVDHDPLQPRRLLRELPRRGEGRRG